MKKRNELGLIDGISYLRKENGEIDWFKMAPPNSVYIKPLKQEIQTELEEKYGKPISEIDPIAENVDQKYLTITLAGLRVLAKIRGYKSIDFDVLEASSSYAAAKCKIEWIGNEETFGEPIIRSDCASVVPETTNWMTKSYLVETACNRAESRAIRTNLGIVAVSREELAGNDKNFQPEELDTPSPNNPKSIALKKMKDMGFNTFAEAKKALSTINVNSFDEYDKLNDIPIEKIMSLIGALNKIGK